MPIRACLCCFLGMITIAARAQRCPESSADGPDRPSASVHTEGTLVYHDGIRKWYSLDMEHPVCQQKSLQIVPADRDADYSNLEAVRGCAVQIDGTLFVALTGYYSLPIVQAADTVTVTGGCPRKPPLPLVTKAKPDSHVRSYRVTMFVDYRPGDHPVRFRVVSGRKRVRQPDAYASYFFTGGFVLYGLCGEGFAVRQVGGTPAAHPMLIDQAAFDPEAAAEKGKYDLRLWYRCVRGKPD